MTNRSSLIKHFHIQKWFQMNENSQTIIFSTKKHSSHKFWVHSELKLINDKQNHEV
jgi:hypothetical protein